MKNVVLPILCSCLLTPLAIHAADTNPPPRLTVELRDGSRVVGTSLEKNFKFQSALLGKIELAVAEIRSIEATATNSIKVKAINGDTLAGEFAGSSLGLKTSFGKVDLKFDSIRKISVASSATTIPQHDGIIAFWSGNGNADDSIGKHPGALMGRANFAPGISGQAFDFDEPGSFVKIPQSADFNPAGQLTIEFWMNADTANAMNNYQGLVTSDFYGVEISNGYGGKMGVNFFISTTANPLGSRYISGQMMPGFRPSITSVANFRHVSDANGGGASVSAGQWHHVAATYDGEQLRLFIDGQPWGNPMSLPGAIRPMLPESFLAIGSEDGRTTCPDCVGQRYFKGRISGVALYNRALSPAEIHEDYEAGGVNAGAN